MPNGVLAFQELYQRGPILGRGASGVAFIVSPKANLEQQFVAKEICVVRSDEKRRRDAFMESQLLRDLCHNNIVKCIDVFQDEEMMYIVMEYATGGDLGARIQARRAEQSCFSERAVMSVFVQICAALHYIHSRKVVHRDLKPPNVFVVGEGELQTCTVKVGDFGIAKIFDCTMGQATSTVGTPSYLSPEICKNNPYGMKSDMWSLGVILYELACLKVPFHASNLPAIAYMICTSEPKPLPDEFGTAMCELVRSLLQKDPAKRPPVARVLQDPFVYQQLPDDIRSEVDGGLDSTAGSLGSTAASVAAALAMPPLLETATSSGSLSEKLIASAVPAPSQVSVPQPSMPQASRVASQVNRGGGRSHGSGESNSGARLPSFGPSTRRQDKQNPPENWCWPRPSDADRASAQVSERGGAKGRPTPRGGAEKDRSRAKDSLHSRARMERLNSFGSSSGVRDRGDRPEKPERALSGPADHGDRADQIDSRFDRPRRAERAARGTFGDRNCGEKGDRLERCAPAKNPSSGYGIAGGIEAERRDTKLVGMHQDVPCQWDANTGLWGDSLQGGRSSCGNSDTGCWNGSDVTLEVVVTPEQSCIPCVDDDRPLCEPVPLAPPAELSEPSPPFAEPPSSSSFISILHSGVVDVQPRTQTRIRRRGRPPLQAADTTDVRSPPKQRPSSRCLEAAGSSPGEQQPAFYHSAPIGSVAASLVATRSVSPTRRGLDILAPGPMLRSSGSAPALPPIPRLAAQSRGVARSRSVVALHDLGTNGYADLPRHGAPNLFRSAPLPISERERSAPSSSVCAAHGLSALGCNAYGESSTSFSQGPSPPPGAPPPQQPPPPPQRQLARDEPNMVRLAPKLPVGLGENRIGRETSLSSMTLSAALGVSSRDGMGSRESASTVSELWGDVDSRLVSARLQSVV
eukprot:TRINITY_DN38778_c0_g1_i1.p1 TRINITY_DN38778_c0_g1~~TRINITY_DN38778_c0_g1_i1.p1  ORF type:complete len:918 (-),score=101.96 TRINITY_DN38778_c0_g1_i1:89-2842(-)